MPRFRKDSTQSGVSSAVLHRKILRKISFYFNHWQFAQSVYPIISKSFIHATTLLNEKFVDVLSNTLYMIIGKFVLFTETSCSYSVPLAQSYCNKTSLHEKIELSFLKTIIFCGICFKPVMIVAFPRHSFAIKKRICPKKYKK